ncbi:MAG: serine hydrolase [Lysinibacillus sp.]
MIVCLALVFCIVLPSNSLAGGSGQVVMDGDTGRILIGSNQDERLPIASLTKIWTALVAIENSSLEEEVTITSVAATAEGSSIYLQAGEKVTVKTLLYGLMLRSGNDAATALAEHVGGSVEGFVYLMNERAQLAGLTNTVFMNPSGLHHEQHLSTARDTAEMLRVALQNDTFKKVASTVLYRADTENGMLWENKHRLVREGASDVSANSEAASDQADDGETIAVTNPKRSIFASIMKKSNGTAFAGKTGFTKVAGRTLATAFRSDDQTAIVVTLNVGDDWNVHRSFAASIWNKYDVVTVAKPGKYKVNDEVTVQLENPIRLQLTKEEKAKVRHVLHISRTSEEAIWHVFLEDERLFATSVAIVKKK